MRIISTFLVVIVFANSLSSQNCCTSNSCYIRLPGFSGFNIEDYQDQLRVAACELVQAMPNEFQSQFKVIDFGFYSINENMQEGFLPFWEKAIQLAENQSPYYLLFGKQSDNQGLYTKFWFKLKLPTEGSFSCFESDYFDKIEFKIKKKTKEVYENLGKSPTDYANAEIAGLKELQSLMSDIINCCVQTTVKSENTCSLCLSLIHI